MPLTRGLASQIVRLSTQILHARGSSPAKILENSHQAPATQDPICAHCKPQTQLLAIQEHRSQISILEYFSVCDTAAHSIRGVTKSWASSKNLFPQVPAIARSAGVTSLAETSTGAADAAC